MSYFFVSSVACVIDDDGAFKMPLTRSPSYNTSEDLELLYRRDGSMNFDTPPSRSSRSASSPSTSSARSWSPSLATTSASESYTPSPPAQSSCSTQRPKPPATHSSPSPSLPPLPLQWVQYRSPPADRGFDYPPILQWTEPLTPQDGPPAEKTRPSARLSQVLTYPLRARVPPPAVDVNGDILVATSVSTADSDLHDRFFELDCKKIFEPSLALDHQYHLPPSSDLLAHPLTTSELPLEVSEPPSHASSAIIEPPSTAPPATQGKALLFSGELYLDARLAASRGENERRRARRKLKAESTPEVETAVTTLDEPSPDTDEQSMLTPDILVDSVEEVVVQERRTLSLLGHSKYSYLFS